MQLTPAQKNLLRNYLASRDHEVTAGGELKKAGPALWVVPIAVLLLGLAMASQASSKIGGVFLIGYVAGMVHYHWRRVCAYSRVWPVLRHVLDWAKVEELTRDQEG